MAQYGGVRHDTACVNMCGLTRSDFQPDLRTWVPETGLKHCRTGLPSAFNSGGPADIDGDHGGLDVP